MDVDGLLRTVADERLDAPSLYGSPHPAADSVVVTRDADAWTVFLMGERGSPWEKTVRTFADEPAALEYALTKLRQVRTTRNSLARLSEEETP